jgi:poly(A) polymerase
MSKISYLWIIELIFKQKPAVKKIISIIESYSYKVRIVGGCIRNILLNVDIKDVDLVTDCLPEQIIKILSEHKYKVIPIGLTHGTVAVNVNGELIEITTARSDVSCDGRHAEVVFCKDFKIDASRRDFTVNAISIDSDGNLYDYYGGIEDIAAKKISFIGDANSRVKEDYLRILRLFRFYGEYFESIDNKALLAAKTNVRSLVKLSGERVYNEIEKIFLSKNNYLAVDVMHKSGAFDVIFGNEAGKLDFLARLIHLEKILDLPKNFLRYLVALLCGDDFSYMFNFWIKKKSDILYLKTLQNIDFNDVITEHKKKYYLYKYGYNIARDILILNAAKKNIIEFSYIDLDNLAMPIFPVSGNDIMMLGLQGKEIGDCYRKLEKIWIDSNFALTQKELIRNIQNEKN